MDSVHPTHFPLSLILGIFAQSAKARMHSNAKRRERRRRRRRRDTPTWPRLTPPSTRRSAHRKSIRSEVCMIIHSKGVMEKTLLLHSIALLTIPLDLLHSPLQSEKARVDVMLLCNADESNMYSMFSVPFTSISPHLFRFHLA